MSSSIQTINVNTPFLLGVPNSRVSPEWIRLLAALVSSNNSGVTADDTTTFVFTDREPVDYRPAVDELRNADLIRVLSGTIRQLTRRVDELEAQLQRKAPPSVSPDDVNALISCAGNRFGRNGNPPQAPIASAGACPAGGAGTAAGGWDTAAHRDAAIALINNIRAALINNGMMT